MLSDVLLSHFTTINSACYLFNFQPSDQTIFLRQTSRLDHDTSPSDHRTRQSDQRSSYSSLIHNRTSSDPTIKSDHQNRPPPSNQTTRSDQPARPQTTILQTEQDTQPLEMVQVRCILYGLGQGGYIELWMNLAKHTFHTLSA